MGQNHKIHKLECKVEKLQNEKKEQGINLQQLQFHNQTLTASINEYKGFLDSKDELTDKLQTQLKEILAEN